MDVRRLDEMQAQGRSIFDTELAVAYYARVSTDKDEQINSLGNQKRYFEDYIAANPHWTFAGGYVDEGISGTSVEGREQFLQMIEDAKRGRFDLIVTKEISRFARNTLDSLRYTRELLRCGVGVYFQNDNINTFDKDAELRLTIMSSIAQDEVRKLSERTRFGLSVHRRTACCSVRTIVRVQQG
ncbi:MAG: recombinase family protein [Butyricicoccus sp.]